MHAPTFPEEYTLDDLDTIVYRIDNDIPNTVHVYGTCRTDNAILITLYCKQKKRVLNVLNMFLNVKKHPQLQFKRLNKHHSNVFKTTFRCHKKTR